MKGKWDHSTKPSKFVVIDKGEEIYRGGFIDGNKIIEASKDNVLAKVIRDFANARKECEEQARLLGMSAEREADLIGKLDRLKKTAADVIRQWESPAWKLTEPTAGVIYRLRDALETKE